MRYLLLGFVCSAVFSSPFASATEASRTVTWKLSSEVTGGLLASIFSKHGEYVSSAKCEVRVVRPRMGLDAVTSEENYAQCLVPTSAEPLAVSFPLSEAPIDAWGNRFYPKGFSVSGRDAEKLFTSMKKLYSRTALARTLGKAPSRLRFEHAALAGSGFVFDYDQFKLYEEDGAGGWIAPMICGRYYYYAPGSPRPARPNESRCDFIYQWHYIEGDTL